MAKPILFEGRTYSFPDDATDDEIMEALEGLTPALDLPVAPGADVAPVPALGGDPLAVAAQQRQTALEADVARQGLTPGDRSTYDLELARSQRREAATVTSLPVGSDRAVTEDTRFSFPTFRPTRIREVAQGGEDLTPAKTEVGQKEPEVGTEAEKLRARYRNLQVSDLSPEVKERSSRLVLDRLVSLGAVDALSEAELGRAILATSEDTPEFKKLTAESARRDKVRADELKALTSAELGAAEQPPGVRPEGQRVYVDPFTGEARKPTAGEELTEAFAKQQKLSPSAANDAARRIEEVRKEVERRKRKGEDVGFADALTGGGPLFSGILSERGEDFRQAGTVETELGAAFRSGLGTLSALAAEGYFGLLGYEVDESGVPLDPNDFGLAVANLRKSVGIPDVISTRQGVGIPTPGVATQRTQRKTTTFDPEGQRRVSGIEVPSALDDPKGFVDAEQRRLARNIASGRTLGDEFLDAPSVREHYRKFWGDEDAAYWAGSAYELLIPAGPGTLLRAGGKLGKAAAGSKAGVRAGEALISAAEAARGPGGSATGLRNVVLQPAVDVVAALSKGEVADGRLARRIANKVLDDMNIDSTLREQAKRKIKGSSNTLDAITQDVSQVLGRNSDEIRYFDNTLNRNTPGDMVLITNRVAVPRELAAEWRGRSLAIRREALVRPTVEVQSVIRRAQSMSGTLADSQQRALTELAKFVDARAGERYLSAADRVKAEQLWQRVTPSRGRFNPLTDRGTEAIARELESTPTGKALADRLRAADGPMGAMVRSEDYGRIMTAVEDELVDRALMREIPQQARLTRDLTAAQVAMRDLDYGFLSGPVARRLVAAVRGTPAGGGTPIASARAARQIQAAGQSLIRNTGKELAEISKVARSADEGVNALVRTSLGGVAPDEAWLKALEAIYGNGEVAQAAYRHALADSASFGNRWGGPWVTSSGFAELPEVQTLKAVDRSFASSGKAGAGSKLIGGRGGPGGFLAPDYQKALLKVVVEEGLRKVIAQAGIESDVLAGGLDVLTGAKARFTQDLTNSTRAPAQAKTLEAALPLGPGARIRVYDPAAYDVERLLADGGNELLQLAEGINPRIRGPLTRMASDAFEWSVRGVGRNIEQMGKYGYVLPNVPYIAWASAKPYLVSLITQGLEGTLAATRQQISKRNVLGGGIVTRAGRTISPEELRIMAQEQGLGMSAVEASRVGSLSDDILRDARSAAERAKGPLRRYADFALDEANPMSKSLGQRIAESIELSFRQATFESKLIDGLSPNDAAEAARRASLDYGAAPAIVRDRLGAIFAEASATSALAAELVQLARTNPDAARIVYKSLYLRARSQDPFGTQGDAALKSVFTIPVGESDYYIPGSESAMAPIEAGLAMAKAGNVILGTMARVAADAPDPAGGSTAVTVMDGGVALARGGLDAALPLLAQFIDAANAGRGGGYVSTDVPSAPAMTDDAAFWASAVVAHHLDPDRKGGEWARFTQLFQPVWLNPPKGYQAYPDAPKDDPRSTYWSSQPPEGTPYLVWGTDPETNETVYKVFQASEAGKANLALARKLPLAAAADKGLVGSGIWLQGLTPSVIGAGGVEVRPGSMVPRIEPTATGLGRGAAEALLGRVPTPAAERARQAATILVSESEGR